LKDQYVGDVNDFAKYQLLRLAEAHFGRVLVAWMLTAKDGRNDGGQLGYLADPALGATDPELFEALTQLVADGHRSVAAVEASGALPGCGFHSAPMPGGGVERAQYFAALVDQGDPETLVFLDPDNGLEVQSVAMGAKGAERYLYWSELRLLRNSGSSVLVYQHFPRVQRIPYLEKLLGQLSDELGDAYETFAAYSSRVGFLFGLHKEHHGLREAVATRCESSPLLSFLD
jgi:hypothetical protein